MPAGTWQQQGYFFPFSYHHGHFYPPEMENYHWTPT